jgi:hypothetical protein
MVNDDLNENESMMVLDFFKKKGIEDRYEIKKTDKIVEVVGHGNEKVSLFRNLEKDGDGQQKGKDDDTTEH